MTPSDELSDLEALLGLPCWQSPPAPPPPAPPARRSGSGKPRLRDFGVDHRAIAVDDTREMAEIRRQIADLEARYQQLREAEQRQRFAAYLRTVRANEFERTMRAIGAR